MQYIARRTRKSHGRSPETASTSRFTSTAPRCSSSSADLSVVQLQAGPDVHCQDVVRQSKEHSVNKLLGYPATCGKEAGRRRYCGDGVLALGCHGCEKANSSSGYEISDLPRPPRSQKSTLPTRTAWKVLNTRAWHHNAWFASGLAVLAFLQAEDTAQARTGSLYLRNMGRSIFT